MIRRLVAAFFAVLLVCFITLPGCGNKNDNVMVDSNKTVKPKTPQQIQAIQNNPNIPAHIKAMMIGHGGGPPMGKTGQTKP